jgi:hypothetical protein
VRNTKTGTGQGDAFVPLSDGSGFGLPEKWSDWICLGVGSLRYRNAMIFTWAPGNRDADSADSERGARTTEPGAGPASGHPRFR